jgi:hypothetical protein
MTFGTETASEFFNLDDGQSQKEKQETTKSVSLLTYDGGTRFRVFYKAQDDGVQSSVTFTSLKVYTITVTSF